DVVAFLWVENVARQHDAVAEETRGQRAALLLLETGVGAAPRVSSQRLLDGDFLLREPALWMFAVQRAPIHGGVDTEDWAQWRHRPVGAKGEDRAGVEQRAISIRRGAALRSNAALGPATVIDDVVRLHRRDHAQLLEARNVRRPQVLGVLDAEAAVARP